MIAKLRRNPNKLNLYLDVGLLIAFVVEMEEHFTGLHNHELLGLAFGLAILIHVALHWNWVVSITKRFFSKVFHESRLNYVLNVALFVDMAVIVVTGVLISRTIGLRLAVPGIVEPIHLLSSYMSLVLIGLHVALHWKWIITHAQKYLLPSRQPKASTAVMVTAKPIAQEGQS
ncbi:MAG: DUF4405 domain-containing protein [Chloroflexi bacterium]|nr:DUF4405 domain-containing protein [Chloroflexota bacterium]